MDEVSGNLDNPLLVVPLAKGAPMAHDRDGKGAPQAAAAASKLFHMPPASSSGATLRVSCEVVFWLGKMNSAC